MSKTEDIPADKKIAIVGIGCRFAAGVDNVEKLWKALEEGRDCTSPHPEGRYDVSYFLSPGEKLPGKIYNLRGAFLTQDPYKFDRYFFKMSPEEAHHLDPNIRLLLETTWEALEDAGIPSSAVRGTQTGVYMGGMSTSEYKTLVSTPEHNIGQYTNSGNTSCMISNRLSYEFDFRGPSLSLDTACSSSLYAIYLACEALKSNHCPMAIAGGVNMMLLPHATMGLCQAGMVSPDGRSKSFDKSADGYGRGEGVGVVVLKTLAKALTDKDRIYAVIRGGALSNDGRTTGITSPSSDAQRKLLESACLDAKVAHRDITYSEAHGTGTAVGDKTEASVLGEFLGQSRSTKQPPLYVGSIKSNFGHTESTAGIAGVIKTALCLKNRVIPRVVHFNSPNPSLDFRQLNIFVPQTTTPWPSGAPLIASCSSFGFGGSNACMILEAASTIRNPREKISTGYIIERKPTLLLLSAASKEALQQRLRDWLTFLQTDDIHTSDRSFRSALYTAAQRSHHHQHRIGFVVTGVEDAIELIRLKLAEDDVKARSVEGVARNLKSTATVAFVFSGMGTQWWGMARELMHTDPVFASVIKEIEKCLKTCGTKWSLMKMLTEEDDFEAVNKTEIAQPCICAVQIGLVEVWRSRGLVPDVVVGHSVGEVAAAYCAGLLTLEHAISLIYHRGKQLQKTSDSGTMVAVLHPFSEVLETMKSKEYDQRLDIAAINSPSQIVISGDSNSINDLMTEFKTNSIRCVQLKVRNAFHSRQQDCLEKTFKQKVSKFLRPQNSIEVNGKKTIPMLSTVTGHYLTREEANTSEYWWRNIRQQVLFQAAIESLFKDGFQVFVEIGSHPALTPAINDTLNGIREASAKPITAGSLLRPRDISKPAEDRVNLLLNHAKLFVSGVSANFASYFDDHCVTVSLPKYPWQREPCSAVTHDARDEFQFPVKHHHLLGEEQERYIDQTSFTKCWNSNVTNSSVPWLKDHVVGGVEILPASAYVELSLAASRVLSPGSSPIVLRNMDIQKFMYVPEGEGFLETTAEELTPTRVKITIRSRNQARDKWTQHMEVDLMKQTSKVPGRTMNIDSITKRCSISVAKETILEDKEGAGLKFGPSFQATTHAFVNDTFTEVLSYCEAPDVIFREFGQYIFHPALLDCCFQSYAILLSFMQKTEAETSGTLIKTIKQVPSNIQRFSLFKEAPRRIVVHLSSHDDDNVTYCDITIGDADTNQIISEVQRLEFRKFEVDIDVGPHIWSTIWMKVSSAERRAEGRRCLLFPDEAGLSTTVVKHLKASGVSTVVANHSIDPKDAIEHYFSDTSQPFSDILVLKPLDMADALLSLNSNSEMALEDFRKIQEKYPLFCLSLILGITNLKSETWPRTVFFTAGSHIVNPGENVNPFMSHIQSIVMTAMYEYPKLHVVSIDLPLEAEPEEKSSMIYRAFHDLPDDENILAYRKSDAPTDATAMNTLAPRLHFDSTSDYRIKTNSKSWMITQDNKKAKLSLKSSTIERLPMLSAERVSIDLRAFCINAVEDDSISASNGSNNDKHFTLCAGIKQDNCGNKESKKRPTKVLGITDCILSSTITLSSEDEIERFAEIPEDMECSEAMQLVMEYLPAQLYFRDTFSLVSSTNILYVTDEEVPARILSFPLLAYVKGAHITVISIDKDLEASKIKILKKNGNCNTINIDDINKVQNSTADLLIVPMTSTTLLKQSSSILPKLKTSGTVLYLSEGIIKQQTIMPSMSAVRFMTFSASLPRAFRGQTLEKLMCAIRDILHLCKEHRRLPKLSETSDQNSLSTVPLVNRTVPKSTIIAVEEEQTELPFELHDDTWFADKGGSYLVTGGTSGFGLSLVKWLVTRGAEHIFVLSRGPPSEEAQRVFTQANAANIQHYQAELSDANQIEKVLVSIRDSKSPPLVGVFHLAAQYRDGFIYNMTTDSWNSVLETKAYGALLLHQLTQKLQIPLRHFVVSSSIVTMIGNAGQSNYCAANNFMNSLCQMRHHLGLPVTCMCIGYINRVGYAASHNLVKAGEERGIMSLSPEEVLKAFNVAMKTGTPLIGIGGPLIVRRFVEKRKNLIKHHLSEKQGRFSLFKTFLTDVSTILGQPTGSFRQIVLEKSEEEAKTMITDSLCKIILAQLGTSDTIDKDVSLVSLGLDSLLATSISEAIVDLFKVTISPVELINENTSTQMLQLQIFRQIKEASDENTYGETTPQDVQVITKPWILDGPSLVDASMFILVCFPPSGGGISFFTSWSSHAMKYGIQLLMVQLPGWEGLENEEPLHSMNEILPNLTKALVPRLRGHRFIFLGHSLGSLIAFETAHQLEKHNLRPIHIFLSSWYAPTLPYPHPEELKNVNKRTFGNLQKVLETEKALYKHVMKQQGIEIKFLDDVFLNNPVLLSRMLPAIEATYDIIKAYHCQKRVPLPYGMTVFGGKNDPFVSPRLLSDWKRQVAPGFHFKKILLEGNHMHILGNTGTVLKEIGLVLRRYAKK